LPSHTKGCYPVTLFPLFIYIYIYIGIGGGYGYTWGCSQLWEVGGNGERGNTSLFGHRGAMFEMRLGRPNLGIGPGAFFFP
jgi:hypothetical protein